MESIEINPTPTPCAITTKPLPRIVNTIVVYISEDMLDLNTPKYELETIARHSRVKKNERPLLLKVLPVFALQDPYMIGLLGQQKYIDIVKQSLDGWKRCAVLFFFPFLYSCCNFIGHSLASSCNVQP
jgi:hypothetical protein